jgi:uncharacterized protein
MKNIRNTRDFAFNFGAPASRALVAIVLQLVLLALLATFARHGIAKDTDPIFSSHVTDSAGVMGAQAAVLDNKLKAYEAATGHQVFVLTVSTTGSRSIDEYAVEVFQKWKVGRKKVDDGVLFVVAVADRKMRIEVGYGLEVWLTDAQCSRIIHDVVAPHFADGEYGAGIEAGVERVLRTLALPFPPTAPAPSLTQEELDRGKYIFSALLLPIVLIAVIASTLSATVGLLLTALSGLLIPAYLYPGWPGQLLYAAMITVWLCARWAIIAKDVRKYHLKRSTNHFATWLWVFFFAMGTGRPLRKGEKKFFRVRSSFGWSETSGSSSGGDSNGGGSGGRSGGAGAAGGW